MAQKPAHRWLLLLSPLLVAACTLSLLRTPGLNATAPAATSIASRTPPTSEQTVEPPGHTALVDPTVAPSIQAVPTAFCDDPRPLSLINTFKEAIGSADGALLASLVSPLHGMDARLLRDGRVVNYDRQHAAALFESTYVVDWGIAPGSGMPIKGSFRELFVPNLQDVFSKSYTVKCNQIQSGGATYSIRWPYQGVDYYSLYYPGSAAYGQMDWHTWVLGMQIQGEQAFLLAIMQFKWEP